MNLAELKTDLADDGAVMQVMHPATEEPIDGMTITLMGTDSKAYGKIKRAREQAAINRAMKGKNANKIDADKLAEDSIDDLVKMTLSWSGLENGDKEIKCTPENARATYTDYPWLKEQAQTFINDRANFFRKSDG